VTNGKMRQYNKWW